jgi:ribonuclease HII
MHVGVDEAGRGALAGPIVVAGVGNLPADAAWLASLRDSKKLTARRRDALYDLITSSCYVCTKEASPRRIDEVNVFRANQEAMGEVVTDAFRSGAARVTVDGNAYPDGFEGDARVTCLVRADTQIKEVMAASIVAKVSRDRLVSAHASNDRFAFARHKGYGTTLHYAELHEHGAVAGWHRQTFNLHTNRDQPRLPFVITK